MVVVAAVAVRLVLDVAAIFAVDVAVVAVVICLLLRFSGFNACPGPAASERARACAGKWVARASAWSLRRHLGALWPFLVQPST